MSIVEKTVTETVPAPGTLGAPTSSVGWPEIAFVGEALGLASRSAATRAPPGATTKFANGRIIANVPGVWRFGVQRIVVFPKEAYEAGAIKTRAGSYLGRERSHNERMGILASMARHLADAAFDALTPERPLPPVSIMPFGGDHGQ
jgi:hypothetical protein